MVEFPNDRKPRCRWMIHSREERKETKISISPLRGEQVGDIQAPHPRQARSIPDADPCPVPHSQDWDGACDAVPSPAPQCGHFSNSDPSKAPHSPPRRPGNQCARGRGSPGAGSRPVSHSGNLCLPNRSVSAGWTRDTSQVTAQAMRHVKSRAFLFFTPVIWHPSKCELLVQWLRSRGPTP